jgi:4-diphosphocytidyl-2-C-methyl-D-erythritol kinase
VRLVEAAPAKVNLFLHVGAAQPDGYHPICSLMVFADVGDELSLEDAESPSFEMTGPFAAGLAGEGDNLVTRAMDRLLSHWRFRPPPLRLVLDKRLPVASGLGGGSADAAAALRLLARRFNLDMPEETWTELALGLGADVPACLRSRAAWAEGRGERLSPPPTFPAIPAVLVNPGVAVATGQVFSAFNQEPTTGPLTPTAPSFANLTDLYGWLAGQRNDLQTPAKALAPAIGQVLRALGAAPECRLARMSGSGASCFALCDDAASASALAGRLSADHPNWWVQATTLGG